MIWAYDPSTKKATAKYTDKFNTVAIIIRSFLWGEGGQVGLIETATYCSLTSGGPFQLGICSDIPESWSPELSPPLPPGDMESPAPSMDGNSQEAELTTATGESWMEINVHYERKFGLGACTCKFSMCVSQL